MTLSPLPLHRFLYDCKKTSNSSTTCIQKQRYSTRNSTNIHTLFCSSSFSVSCSLLVLVFSIHNYLLLSMPLFLQYTPYLVSTCFISYYYLSSFLLLLSVTFSSTLLNIPITPFQPITLFHPFNTITHTHTIGGLTSRASRRLLT